MMADVTYSEPEIKKTVENAHGDGVETLIIKIFNNIVL
jgi:hypothetical protein